MNYQKNLNRARKIIHRDFVSKNVSKVKPKIGSIQRLRSPATLYASLYSDGGRRSGLYLTSEYDLAQIKRIQDVESYVSQAFIKIEGLMLKEGWSFTGPNPDTVKYINERFRQMQAASGISVEQLLQRICAEVVSVSNCFLAKTRKASASGGKVRTIPGKNREVEPIAAYFPVAAETMDFQLDAAGKKIKKWRHKIPGQPKDQEFSPEDIVHFTFKKREGFVFGTPSLVPVIDDIKILRKIEENVELLLYQHVFPLFHYKVGTKESPAHVTEDGYDEVAVAEEQIKRMPAEGGIVTSERHELKLIGVDGRIISAEGYLEHFKRRVFSGLSMSSVDFGEPGAANRSTSDTISKNLVDAVKNLQRAIENVFNTEVISELLLEADFLDIDPTAEENLVRLKFNEVDLDAKQSRESHSVDKFMKNAITYDEMRVEIGREPILIPTREEIESGEALDQKYPHWYRTSWKLFDEPKAIIQSMDEPWTPMAKAAATSPSLEINSQQLEEGKKEAEKMKRSEAPQGPPVARAKDVRNENPIVRAGFDSLGPYLDVLLSSEEVGKAQLESSVRNIFRGVKERFLSQSLAEFLRGYNAAHPAGGGVEVARSSMRAYLRRRIDVYVDRLADDLVYQIKDKLVSGVDDFRKVVKIVMDSLRYRSDYIDIAELRHAYVLGQMNGFKDRGVTEVIIVAQGDNPCEKCLLHDQKVVNLNDYSLGELPPFHPSCYCRLKAKE